jgi:hypothetical protein
MGNYLLAYHGGATPETTEDVGAVMAAWEAWMGTLGEALVAPGNPFSHTKVLAADGTVSATGTLTGYSIVSAGDIDAAIALAKGCPIFESDGSIEVAEVVDM